MHKVAIFRALYLGDFLCSIPAVRAIRKQYPTSEITWIGLSQMKSLALRFSDYIDHYLDFPGYPLLTEESIDVEAFASFLDSVRSESFDIIFQLQGKGTIINNLLKSFNAKRTICFTHDPAKVGKNTLLYPEDRHEIERHLALLKHVGISPQGDHLEFPLSQEDQISLESVMPSLSRYICVHPGAKASWRRWPPANFAALADYVAGKGYQVVITGTHDEFGLAEEVARLMRHKPLIASGKLSLGGTAVLLSRSSFLISNCTGVSHLAAALEVPSLVISMDGEPKRWGPLNKKLHHTIDWAGNSSFQTVLSALESSPFIDSQISTDEG